jgi:DNA-binding XRE family transcriptional regulator
MRKFIPVEEIFAEWEKNPAFVAAYDALEEEFALANALIAARSRAGLTQDEIAERMETSQSAVARLEGGRSNASLRTLRRYAAATGSKLHISFQPVAHT